MPIVTKEPLSLNTRLLRDFYIGAVTVVCCLMALAVIVTVGFKEYQAVESRMDASLRQQAEQVSTSIARLVQHTQFMMSQIGQEIRRLPTDDKAGIAEILHAYRENSRQNNVHSWSVFSWINAEHQLVVSSAGGVLEKPVDVSYRSYIADAIREPWRIHFSYAAKGAVTGLWIVPTGLGVTDRQGRHMGVVSMGFDLQGLQREMEVMLKNHHTHLGLAQEGDDQLVLDTGLRDGHLQVVMESMMHPFRVYLEADGEELAAQQRVIILAYGGQTLLILVLLFSSLFWLRLRVVMPAVQSREKEEAARAERDKAQATSKAKSVFIANMSHELRTPLNSVIGFAELLQNETFGHLNEKQHEYVEDIRRSGKTLLELINDILELSRIDAGKLELALRPLDMNLLLMECVRDLTPAARKQDVRLHLSLNRKLPVVEGDPKRLKQVLHNLMANAVKFTPAGGEVQVRAWVEPYAGLHVQVKDTGVGMSESELAIALEKFGQIENELTHQHSGTGLGLPLARELTHLHGGNLTIESEKGKGTTVSLWFPPSCLREPERA